MHFPNGSVITPDGKTLIVGETLGATVDRVRHSAPTASLSNRRVWRRPSPRVPDGIALDANGNIWIANPIAPECALIAPGGKVLDVIDTGQPCYACMLGGDDGRTLFMLTAQTSIAHEAAAAPKGQIADRDRRRAARGPAIARPLPRKLAVPMLFGAVEEIREAGRRVRTGHDLLQHADACYVCRRSRSRPAARECSRARAGRAGAGSNDSPPTACSPFHMPWPHSG